MLQDCTDFLPLITPQELNVLSNIFQQEQPQPSIQTKFNLAYGLCRSTQRDDVNAAIQYFQEIYDADETWRRDCLYYLALAHFKLGEFKHARKYARTVLAREPSNVQMKLLLQKIEGQASHDGLLGIAIVGGLVAIGSLALSAIFKKKN